MRQRGALTLETGIGKSYTAMLNCRKIERLVAQYVVGSLPWWSHSAVVRHLDRCKPCRRLVETHHRVAVLLDALPRCEPPAPLGTGIAGELRSPPSGRSRLPSAPRNWRPGALAAGAGLAVGVLLSKSYSVPGPSPSAPIASSPTVASFVEQHSRLSGQDLLADPISLGAVGVTARRDNVLFERAQAILDDGRYPR